MRFKTRSAFLALMAVCALGAVAATSASAASNYPEFKPGIGAKFPIAFSGTSGELSFRDAGGVYVCNKSTISGEITGPKELSKVKLGFFEGTCALSDGLGFCWSEAPHSWTTNELKGKLGYRSKAAKSVGFVFEPVSGSFAECGMKEYPEGKILGSVLSSVQPALTQTTSFTLTMNEASSKEKLEGEATRPSLERKWYGREPEVATLSDKFSITTAQKLEIGA
jgi:hypothetical protein